MTKEIIIDGVDVAECKYYNAVVNEEPYCNIDEEHLYTCSSDTNCYYKQLKRLEQENFELKESLKCFQTPEAIKALTFYKTGEFELQEKKCIKLEQENAELKHTLQEIKEIAEFHITDTDSEDVQNDMKQILDLITKAEEE